MRWRIYKTVYCYVYLWNIRLRRGGRFEIFLDWCMEVISGTKQYKQFLQANDKLYEGMELPTKHIGSCWMEKISWWGNIESHLYLQTITFLHWPVLLKGLWKTQFLDFMKLKRIIEDGNGRICCLILAHVLIQMKCCLFLVILSSFHRRGRRHYIRAVKMFGRKPSVLYTMILKSLIHCWDNFEQKVRMLIWYQGWPPVQEVKNYKLLKKSLKD